MAKLKLKYGNKDLSFGQCFLIIFLFHISWLIAFFPGIITADSCGQLLMCLWRSYNDHHPLISSLLMYCALLTGRTLFHSDNIGLFIYVTIQALVQVFVFTYCMEYFKQKKTPRLFRVVVFLFFCIFPLFPNFSIVCCKDVGYALSCLLCFISLRFSLITLPSVMRGGIPHQVLWILSIIGICTFRHEGKIIAAAVILLLFFAVRKKRKLAITGLLSMVAVLVVNSVLLFGLHGTKGSVRESLSVPVLITAAYLDKYPEETDENDIRILQSVFEISDVKELSDYRNFDISDDLKGKMVYTPDKKALGEYLLILIRNFFRHPGVYFDVAFNKHSSGYFNLIREKYESMDDFLYILGEESRNDSHLQIYFPEGTYWLRNLIRKFVNFCDDAPVLGLLFNPGFYTVLLGLEILLLLLFRQCTTLVWYLPALLVLIILVLSPLNGSLRYALPLIITAPLYLEVALSQIFSEFTKSK